jgi:hypothetical protein
MDDTLCRSAANDDVIDVEGEDVPKIPVTVSCETAAQNCCGNKSTINLVSFLSAGYHRLFRKRQNNSSESNIN